MAIINMLQFPFVQLAFVVGTLIALCCAGLGYFLVLERYALIGDGLAHVSFAAIALSLVLGATPLWIMIPIVMMASLVIRKITQSAKLHGDAAIGLVSSVSAAIAIALASMGHGFNVDIMSYLFGSILAITTTDVWVSLALCSLILVALAILHPYLFAAAYDREFARANGIMVDRVTTVLILLTSLTVALGCRIVGTLLISSLIVFPTITALQWVNSFRRSLVMALGISVVGVLTGIILSLSVNIPTGAAIVLVNAAMFCVAFIGRKIASR